MAVTIRGNSDPVQKALASALEAFQADHPQAQIVLHRQNSTSVRLKVVSPSFAGMDRVDRDDLVWKYLDRLGDEPLAELSLLVLLAPGEESKSLANLEFENPIPSRI